MPPHEECCWPSSSHHLSSACVQRARVSKQEHFNFERAPQAHGGPITTLERSQQPTVSVDITHYWGIVLLHFGNHLFICHCWGGRLPHAADPPLAINQELDFVRSRKQWCFNRKLREQPPTFRPTQPSIHYKQDPTFPPNHKIPS